MKKILTVMCAICIFSTALASEIREPEPLTSSSMAETDDRVVPGPEFLGYQLILMGYSDKIQIIKVYREITGLGLKEAKDAIDNCPVIVRIYQNKTEGLFDKLRLEDAGGVCLYDKVYAPVQNFN